MNDGISAESLWGSIFSLCDPDGKGLVRVSKVLDVLLTFNIKDIMDPDEDEDDSNVSSTSRTETLEELKDILDPRDADPLITQNMFIVAVEGYLHRKNEESKKKKKQRDSWDLQSEIAELKFQLTKLTEENTYLKQQNSDIEDENLNLLSQKEDLQKRLSHRDVSQERVRTLQKELEDTRTTLANFEDLNSVLRSKISRSEKEYSDLEKKYEDLKKEYEAATRELETCNALLSQKDTEIEQIRISDQSLIENWDAKEKWLEDQIHEQSLTIAEFSRINGDFVDVATQSDDSLDEGFCSVEKRHFEEECDQLLIVMKSLQELLFKRPTEKDDGQGLDADLGTEEGPLIEGKGKTLACSSHGQDHEEMIRRLNQELSEFRQQLKKSQELFHVMQTNGSVSVGSLATVTQSCPLLAEALTLKPSSNSVTCSTQTEPSVTSRRSSTQDGPARSLLDAIEDDVDNDANYLDKLSDDISYRLTINLPTVLEESEQETETSPGAGPRRMSSNNRKRLQRSTNAHDEDPEHHSVNHKDNYSYRGEDLTSLTSEADFRSAASSVASSVYNSLERPLQITGSGSYHAARNGNGNDDSDTFSLISGSGDTFGSPMSYRSSPTAYFTPLQGSSSQETITNIDGDKTPVNDENNGDDHSEAHSCPGTYHRTEYENGSLKKRGARSSSTGPSLPIYDHNKESSVGVIPESQKEHMIRYAYDPVRRSSEMDARVLSGQDWRILRNDLEKKGQDSYRKQFAQEEGNDIEGGLGLESRSQRPSNAPDLEEEAEEYLEKFPDLVHNLFEHLDVLKKAQTVPSDFEMDKISTRFNHLAHTFKVEHSNLQLRKDTNLSQHHFASANMERTIHSLHEIANKFEDAGKRTKLPDDITQLILSLTKLPGDLGIYTKELAKTSRRVGMMDVQARLYKMIEVMVLYVHILRNLCAEKDKEIENASNLLEKNSIQTTRTKMVPTINNNNNEKIWDDDESDSQRECDDGHLLQHLLGPKKSNVELDSKHREKLVLKEQQSQTNPILRFILDASEFLRCELFWPWNWEETWRGMKQGFSILLMILGLVIIFRSLFPIVSADDPPPVADLGSVFSKHGKLHHPSLPPV